jgi:hypothetical protein
MHQPLIAAVCEGPAVAAAVEPAMVSAVSSAAAKVRMRRVNIGGLRSGGGRSVLA